MKATNIKWDIDENEFPTKKAATNFLKTLPKELDIPECDKIQDEDDISDYLSETIGFCHKGFYLEK